MFFAHAFWNRMEISVNGTARQVRDGCNIADLIEDLALAGKRTAVEVNLSIVPRSQYAAYPLQPGDQVEIVHAIGGGQPSMDVATLTPPWAAQNTGNGCSNPLHFSGLSHVIHHTP